MSRIRPAAVSDLPAVSEYVRRHQDENGLDGYYYGVRLPGEPDGDTPEKQAALASDLQLGLDVPGWVRMWVILDDAGFVVGELNLRGDRVPSALHRCRLGMGILRSHRGRGLGRALIETAIAWAREQHLAYIDLGVLAGNQPAIALYRRCGFREHGWYPDVFRFGDERIGAISMVLTLESKR
jgi:ribosomal protein S18 acetylase RimI-like enzyme